MTRRWAATRLARPQERRVALVDTVSLPGIMPATIEHQHLLRAMDALVEYRKAVGQAMSALPRPPLDRDDR